MCVVIVYECSAVATHTFSRANMATLDDIFQTTADHVHVFFLRTHHTHIHTHCRKKIAIYQKGDDQNNDIKIE